MTDLDTGETKKTRRSKRESKPSFFIKPRRQFTDEGGTAKFKASFEGEPTPTITWLRNDTALTDGDKYRIYDKSDFHYLEVINARKPEDHGPYTCTIKNSVGEASVTADLEVFELRSQASKWKEPAPKIQTTLRHVEPNKKETSHTKISKPGLKSFEAAPNFTQGLESRTVDVGKKVTLSCRAEGRPEPKLSWHKDGRELKQSINIKITTISGKSDLVIFKAQHPESQGEYTCYANNACGEAKTTATLNISEDLHESNSLENGDLEKKDIALKIPVENKSLSAAEVKKKDTSHFVEKTTKTVGNSSAVNKLKSKFGESIGKKDTISNGGVGQKNIIHQIGSNKTSIHKDDKNIHNGGMSKKEGFAKIKEKQEDKPAVSTFEKKSIGESKNLETGQPVFVKKLQDLSIDDGSKVVLAVEITGAKPMEVCWLHEDSEIKADNKVYQILNNGNIHKLVIAEIYPEDAGMYVCEAYNSLGDDESTCILKVKEPKAPVHIPQQKYSSELQIPVTAAKSNPCCSEVIELKLDLNDTPTVKTTPAVAVKLPVLQNKIEVHIPGNLPKSKPHTSQIVELKLDLNDTAKTTEKSTAEISTKEPVTQNKTVSSKSAKDLRSESLVPPVFIKRPRSENVEEGNKACFAGQVNGDPLPVVRWEKDGNRVENGGRFKISSEKDHFTFEIAHTLATDAGRYVCIAENEAGPKKCSVSLVVKYIDSASNIDLRALLKSRPSLGKIDTTGMETEKEVSQCDFRGVLRRHVQTRQRPAVVTELRDVKANEGKSVALQCKIRGTPAPTITWFVNKKEIKASKFFQMSYENEEAKLVIAEVYPEDQGEYTCVATNDVGTAQTTCEVLLKDLQDRKLTGSMEYLQQGRRASGTQDYFDERKSSISQELLQERRPSLRQDDKHDKKSSNIKVNILKSSTAQESHKDKKDLEEKKKSSILKVNMGTSSHERSLDERKSSLSDPLSQEKKSSILKVKLGQSSHANQTQQEESLKDKKSTILKKEQHNDSTVPHEQETTLPSDDKPAVHESKKDRAEVVSKKKEGGQPEPPLIESLTPANVHVLRGKPLELEARYIGYPPPEVRWFRDKTELESDSRMTIDVSESTVILSVPRVESCDTGCYTLFLWNELGQDFATSSVTIDDTPLPPVGQPAARNITGTSLNLSWYGPSFDGGSQVTHYRVEVRCTKDTEWTILTSNCVHTSYHVEDLEPNMEYLFRVSAANKHGFSEPGKPSDHIFTIDRRPTLREGLEVEVPSTAYLEKQRLSLFMLSSPLSPAAFWSARDELPFEPRNVQPVTGRKFEEFYTLGDKIGKGKFGSVYKCEEKSCGKTYAAKFIRLKPKDRELVKQEISVMNILHHPKLLLLWDAFDTPRELVLVLEHIAGGELMERIINDDYILTERECIHFMRQICDGVLFMHNQNVLHLDLKPENVLCITKNSNEIKIIDFGLARIFDPNKPTQILFGTPEFVAPEVVNYEQIGYNTDMWSLGVICYILISGLSPFLDDTADQTLSNVTGAQWDFDDESFDDISSDCKEFITLLLKKRMKDRMSAAETMKHKWLAQDVKYMKAKRLSTAKHKKYMATKKWQKTGNAIRALGRMASLQKALTSSSSTGSISDGASSPWTSRQNSVTSDPGTPSPVFKADSLFSSCVKVRLHSLDSPLKDQQVANVKGKKIDNTKKPSDDKSESKNPSNESQISKKGLKALPKVKEEDLEKEGNNNNVKRDAPIESANPEPPTFLKKMRDVEVFEGDIAKFEVKLSGEPYPKITWYKEGMEIKEREKYEIEEEEDGLCSLIIRDCCVDDDADYECKLKNSSGEVFCTAALYVDSVGPDE